MAEVSRAASVLMEGISLALGLPDKHFAQSYLRRPTTLFRVFRYPPAAAGRWGVGEHTDYGLLTLLAQDDCGGLQVRTDTGWIEAPPVAGTLVCNVGDMLERLSGGALRVGAASGLEWQRARPLFLPALLRSRFRGDNDAGSGTR